MQSGPQQSKAPVPGSAPSDAVLRVCYLCTTFPLLSETFIQREILALSKREDLQLEIYSIWKGRESFDRLKIRRYSLWKLPTLLFWLPYWLLRQPRPLIGILGHWFRHGFPTFLNAEENLLGAAFALTEGRRFSKSPPDLFHANWATMPATASLLLSQWCNRPYTMGAHAYDIFEKGGDALLAKKLKSASWIQCSSEMAAQSLRERFGHLPKIQVVRRSLEPMPEARPFPERFGDPVRLLSVGRLVPKKNYPFLIRLVAACREAGLACHATIVGEGRERGPIESLVSELRLTEEVHLAGALPPREVLQLYQSADAFCFTGTIAPDGDRDGLPNVIPEAMAVGVPVISSSTRGPMEAVLDGENGLLRSLDDPTAWQEAIRLLRDNRQLRHRLVKQARQWVETHFDSADNAASVAAAWRSASHSR